MKPKFIIDLSKPQTLLAGVRGLFTEQQEAFHSILNAEVMKKLPEEFRAQLAKLKETVDSQLTAMADRPTDQVPAANDASWAIQHMAHALAYMQELSTAVTARMNELMSKYGGVSEQAAAYENRLQKGELLELPAVQEKIKTAVDEALAKERNRVTLLTQRRTLLAEKKLPLPAEDKTIEGDDAAFTTLHTTAANRLAKLTEELPGAIEQLNGLQAAALLYGPEENFKGHLAMAKALAGRGGPGGAEPLAGGEGESAGGNGKAKLRIV